MQSQFGTFLRELRTSCGLSQMYVAQQAGVGRVTLNRWESGKQAPRLVEMETVLKALGATAEQIRQAIHLLGTAEGRRYEVGREKHAAEKTGVGTRPHAGSLLLALRLRAGLSQEEAAQKVGVATRTLRRWEKAEVWPSDEQLHTLCYVLGAHPKEVLALTQGGADLEIGASGYPLSLEEVMYQAQTLYYFTHEPHLEPLKDLRFMALESQAWHYAVRSQSGRDVLSLVYSYHATRCTALERWSEGMLYAQRSLDLLSPGEKPHTGAIQAAIAYARCTTYHGAQLAPARGIEMLQQWLDVPVHPVLESWILSDMAKYGVLEGKASQNLGLIRRACEAVAGTEFTSDLFLREMDEAQILLQAGEAAQALQILERERPPLRDEYQIHLLLLEAEIALALHDANRASECVRQAQQLISLWSFTHFQTRAQKIIQQL